MMYRACTLLFGAAVALAAVQYTKEQVAQEITNLPDSPAVPWRQFSGYIDVPNRGSMFYWFVESQGNPSKDPVLLWTNGGPGCSGLTGFFTEHGPFRPTKEGNLTLNPQAWNQLASMVYIEQPVGVGFSVATGKLEYNDKYAANDNLNFVKGFFDKFPQFKSNKFFITSESYGGHYMPTLAQAIVEDGGVPNFAGFLVGNPLTYLQYRNFGEFATYYGHQLIPKPMWDRYLLAGCKDGDSPACDKITAQMEQLTAGLDPYALDFPKCADGPLSAGRHERWAMRRTILKASKKSLSDYPYFPTDYQPCDSDWATTYLNRKDVQAVIGATGSGPTWNGKWGECNDVVGNAYSALDVAAPMMPVYESLYGKIKMLVMSGDDDAVCATRGTQQWIWDTNRTVVSEWAPWTMEDGPGCPGGPACKQTAGYAVKFDGLTFVTVHGAGHLVPATRPVQGLEVLRKFLGDEW